MDIGTRIRDVREQKRMSQGDIETSTGLLRCYISRVENGHTVPSIETLEKIARALDLKLYQLLYDASDTTVPAITERTLKLSKRPRKEGVIFKKLRKLLPNISKEDREMLVRGVEDA